MINKVLYDITIGLITGFVSGCVSGLFVYWLTKRREEKYSTFYFWENFLYGMLGKCEMYIPINTIHEKSNIGDKDSDWGKAIQNLLDLTNPYGHEDTVPTEEQSEIFENIVIALNKLYAWAKKNKLIKNQKKKQTPIPKVETHESK